MRRRMAMALAALLAMALCCGALAEGAPGNRLGLRLLARLGEEQQNAVISPFSLGCGLSMAAAGAGGETREALMTALEAEDAGDIAALAGPLAEVGARWANAAFVEGVTPRPAWTRALEETFDAAFFPEMDMDAINAWARENTDGLIDPLLDEPVSGGTAMVLLNALTFEADWVSPFEVYASTDGVFNAPEGEVEVRYMRQTSYMSYGERDGVQFLRKPYSGGRLALLVALPRQGGMKSVLSGLRDKGLDYFRFAPNPREVSLALPKLDLALDVDLSEGLAASGLEQAFSPEADFSGISDTPLMIGDVRQKLRLCVDEEGTRASVVTEMDMALGMSRPEPDRVEMRVDRPFALLIVDESTGAILFAGAIYNPAA